MSMDVFTLVAIAIIGTVICVLIKQYRPEYTAFAAIGTGIIILVLALPQTKEILDYVENVSRLGEVDSVYIKTITKALGVCVITQLASDTCKDCGQSSIASKVELGGKIAILTISIPFFVSLIETIQKLVNL